MKTDYTAVVKQVGTWWIGWIEEIPGVNCQESTHEELIKSLKETLRQALAFNKKDAGAAAGYTPSTMSLIRSKPISFPSNRRKAHPLMRQGRFLPDSSSR